MQRGLAAIVVLALAGWTPFRAPDPDVEAGNQAYAAGRYDDALAAYDRAARRGGVDGDSLAFDRGTAELKKAEAVADPAEKRRLTDRALDDLKRAGRSRDARIRGAASYNRGNALLGQDKLEDAIEAYKQALRDDASLDDARLNLELALRRRHNQPRPQPQPGQGQGQPQPGQGSQGRPGAQDPQGSGSGANQNGSAGDGASPPSGSGNQGSDAQRNSGGSGPTPNDAGANRPPPQTGQNDENTPSGRGAQPKGPASRGRTAPRSPKTPAEGKLDDLDDHSRRLQKDEARRHATGRAADPQHDW